MKKKTAQDYGKEFEQDFQDEMKLAQRRMKIAYCRLYDTRSAGSYIPEQPGDFLATINGKSFLIECKTSLKYTTMAARRTAVTELVSDNQVAAARIWSRAGAIPIVLFRHGDSELIEVWRGEIVADIYLTPKASPTPDSISAAVTMEKLIQYLSTLEPLNRGIGQ